MKAWALVQLTYRGETYEPDDPMDLPLDTNVEKAEADSMVERGLVTTTAPKKSTKRTNSSQRTGREARD